MRMACVPSTRATSREGVDEAPGAPIPGERSRTASRSGSNPAAETSASTRLGVFSTVHDVTAVASGGERGVRYRAHAPSEATALPGACEDAVTHPTCSRSKTAGLAPPVRNAALYMMFFGSSARTNAQYRESCAGLYPPASRIRKSIDRWFASSGQYRGLCKRR